MSGGEGWSRRSCCRRRAARSDRLAAPPDASALLVRLDTRLRPLAQPTQVGRYRAYRGVPAFLGIRYARAARFAAPCARPGTGEARQGCRFRSGRAASRRRNTRRRARTACSSTSGRRTRTARAKRPVMVYFHGGAYSSGSVTDPLNDGAKLASAATWWWSRSITGSTRSATSISRRSTRASPTAAMSASSTWSLALQMGARQHRRVRRRSRRNVMVFGQSGGGAKIATLMAMPAAKGLFHRAATMSGQQVTACGPAPRPPRARGAARPSSADQADPAPLRCRWSGWSRRLAADRSDAAAAGCISARCST